MGNNAQPQEKPKKGDMIKFQRVGYTHWAIYVGDDYVVHLIGDFHGAVRAIAEGHFPKLAEIRKEKLQDVAGKHKWEVSNYLDNVHRPYPGDAIVKRAMKQVGERRKYDLLVKNCEHFVTLLRYGKEHCQQVEDAAEQQPAVGVFRNWAIDLYNLYDSD